MMGPGERIDLITRCAHTLCSRSWADIDFVLAQFGLPVSDEWADSSEDSRFNYVRQMLGRNYAEEPDLQALDDYLHGVPSHDEDKEPWSDGGCRVFITHLATQAKTANAMKGALVHWGLDAFVAHRDIVPGAEWVRVIVAALHSCDSLVALLHDGFKASDWCDQEVGVAFGRAVPVIPVRIDIDPYGLLGTFQAVVWPKQGKAEAYAAREVIKILLSDKRTSGRAVEAIVQQLEGADSFYTANELSTMLASSSVIVSADQVARLRTAQKQNTQLTEAWDVDASIQALEQRLPKSMKAAAIPVAPPTYDYGSEPF